MSKPIAVPAALTCLLTAALFVATPASAEEISYEGHTLEVQDGQDARPVVRMSGPLYQVGGSAGQIIAKAERCVAAQDGVTLESADAAAGQLLANARIDYRSMFSTRSASSRLAIESGPGRFQITQTALGMSDSGSADTPANGYVALRQGDGGWDNALAALIGMEQALVDCLYR